MRFDELQKNLYEKSTDSVERYLLKLVQAYASNNQSDTVLNREVIIEKAVTRMKEELNLSQAGVISINGQKGVVTITAKDLNAQPIVNKKTAFNVDFGTESGTACEGNDTRLYDKRNPKAHSHEMQDIIGLQGRLSGIDTIANQLKDYAHIHNNLEVLNKLTYSGSKESIDLSEVEDSQANIDNKITEIQTQITSANEDLQKVYKDTQKAITENNVADLTTHINEVQAKSEKDLKDYISQSLDTAKTELKEELKNYITKTEIEEVNAMVAKTKWLIGSIYVTISNIIDSNGEYTLSLQDPMVLALYSDLKYIDMNDYDVRCFTETADGKTEFPYHILEDKIPVGFLSYSWNTEVVKLYYTELFPNAQVSEATKANKITIEFYAKQKVGM